MKFWDASAIVPLLVREKETSHCRVLLKEDAEVVVWFLTPVEVLSALTRRVRERSLTSPEFRRAKDRLALLVGAWSEVISVERVRERSYRLLETHPLRAADALQLAAALLVAEENPKDVSIVTLDGRLRIAAEKEGFAIA